VRRRGVALSPMETRHEVIVGAGRLADELGYEVFAVPEGWGLDSSVLLAELALWTRRITLVSAVVSVWGRTPATLAMTAATLDRLAQGRYVLGLGASTRALVEGLHGVAFERPADKLGEVTTRVRALLAVSGPSSTPPPPPPGRCGSVWRRSRSCRSGWRRWASARPGRGRARRRLDPGVRVS
jgi:alkanesulfonate monooxygenase SsuD/methylene tetrahydromethanopterin reductase-like flavin-dependent oxidoreductase (luciferase family)